MAKAKFLLLTVNIKNETTQVKIIETINKSLDWAKVSEGSWLLWTTTDPKTWSDRIKKKVSPGETLFICEINHENRGGFMPQSFWKFIKSHTIPKS